MKPESTEQQFGSAHGETSGSAQSTDTLRRANENLGDRERGMQKSPSEENVSRDPIMKYFEYSHLPPKLQDVSSQFFGIANYIEATVPRSAERSAGLRKLLEAKDCIVRAAM